VWPPRLAFHFGSSAAELRCKGNTVVEQDNCPRSHATGR